MNQSDKLELHTEKYYHCIKHILYENRHSILGTFIAGFLAFTYAFTNKFPNADDLWSLFGKGAALESGRWGLTLLSLFFPDFSMPWIYGVLSIAFIAAGCCLMVHIFSIKNGILQFLLSALMVVFPSQISIFSYMFTACAYAIAFCLSALAVYYVCAGKPYSYLLSTLCIVFSASIYQAYIAIVASFLVLKLIQDLLGHRAHTKKLFATGVRYVLLLIVSLGTYWIITKMLCLISGNEMGQYADNALVFDLATIVEGIKNAYLYFWQIIRYRTHGIIANTVSHYIHFFCFTLACVELLIWVWQSKKPNEIVLLLFLLALLPLSINCMYIFINVKMIHTLVLHSFTAVYVFLAIIVECGQYQLTGKRIWDRCRYVGLELIILCMTAISLINIYIANEAYLHMYLSYENTYSFTTSVVSQLQQTAGYTEESKVAIIGDYEDPEYSNLYFAHLSEMMGIEGISPGSYSLCYMFEYYNGVSINFATDSEIENIINSPEYSQMASYPNYGCIRNINGVFVIKLSE